MTTPIGMSEAAERPRLPEGWWHIEPDMAVGFEQQLAKEILPGHRVAGRRLQAVAKCDWNDDVLFSEKGDGDRQEAAYWLVHLTWGRPVDARWPRAALVKVPDDLRSDQND